MGTPWILENTGDGDRKQLANIEETLKKIHSQVEEMERSRQDVLKEYVVLAESHPLFKETSLTLSYNPPSETSTELLQSEVKALRQAMEEKNRTYEKTIAELRDYRKSGGALHRNG